MQVVSDIKIGISLRISDVFIFSFYADVVIKMYMSSMLRVSFRVVLSDFHLRSEGLVC